MSTGAERKIAWATIVQIGGRAVQWGIAALTTKTIATTYSRYKEAVFSKPTPQSLVRNCLGGPDDDGPRTDAAFESTFRLNGSQLECGGNDAAAQAIIQNVAQFQVTYYMQSLGPRAA